MCCLEKKCIWPGCQAWLCRLDHAQGQLACGLTGAESSPSNSPALCQASPLRARLFVLHTEGTLSVAFASLTGSGGALNSRESGRALWNRVMASQCQ